MNSAIYKLSREIAYILSFCLSIKLFLNEDVLRGSCCIISLLLFILFSINYEKKYKKITIGYIFVFVIIYINYSLLSCYIDQNMVSLLNNEGSFGNWLSDRYYDVYFPVTSFIYFILIVYTYLTPNRIIRDNITKEIFIYNKLNSAGYLVGNLILLVLYFASGYSYEIAIPILLYLIISIFYRKKIFYIFFILALLPIFYSIFLSRFKLIEVIFPALMIIIFLQKEKNISFWKYNVYFLLCLVIVLLYGVLSELFKLNMYYSGEYSFVDVFSNVDTLSEFIFRQLYRVFIIWIKLGGYIIEHVDKNGIYYGITYIKPLANIFGFKYVSLPIVSAYYNDSTYAQPGLLAEGYANFYHMGAIINILVMFIIMEYMTIVFYRKPSVIRLFLMFIPFGQVILDGGTISSSIFLIILCLLLSLPGFIYKNINSVRMLGFYYEK